MQTETIKVPVAKIISSTDRKHGGQGDIESLARSIQEHGLIQPPAVKKERGGLYRVIAGRRRAAAVSLLKWRDVDVTVYPDDADDEAVALAENANREDAHPLDEAEKFKRMMDAGKPAEELAKYYNRSVSGIHHRVRLTHLVDGIKTMFRDGKISISGAALVASLPEEDQEKFLKKYGGGRDVGKWEISGFMSSVRKSPLRHIADGECETCKKRTRNSAPGLFEDFNTEDICLDGDCYAKKWAALIAGRIADKAGQSNPTEKNIIFGYGIPKIFPAKAGTAIIGGDEYALIPAGSVDIKESGKKAKNGTAWHVRSVGGHVIEADRVAYKKLEAVSVRNNDPAAPYLGLLSAMPEIKEEDRKDAAEKLHKKYGGPWNVKRKAREELLEAVVGRRIREKSDGNWAEIWLAEHYAEEGENGKPRGIDPEYSGLAAGIFGPIASFSEIPRNETLQKVFLFVIAAGITLHSLPDLDDSESEWLCAEETLFWKFAGMTREEYLDMYRERLSKFIAEAENASGEGGGK